MLLPVQVANNVLNNMLVWPQRLVVPLFWDDPTILAGMAQMFYRNQGIMKVRSREVWSNCAVVYRQAPRSLVIQSQQC